jgi:uncharacterized membrane protein YhaH (DUF805 family)
LGAAGYFFSCRGRLSRRDYWRRSLLAMLLFFLIGVFFMVTITIFLIKRCCGAHGAVDPVAFVVPVIGLDFAIYIWALVAVACRRCHDLGLPGGAMLRLRVSSAQLSFRRGMAGPNQFGPDPLEKVLS